MYLFLTAAPGDKEGLSTEQTCYRGIKLCIYARLLDTQANKIGYFGGTQTNDHKIVENVAMAERYGEEMGNVR